MSRWNPSSSSYCVQLFICIHIWSNAVALNALWLVWTYWTGWDSTNSGDLSLVLSKQKLLKKKKSAIAELQWDKKKKNRTKEKVSICCLVLPSSCRCVLTSLCCHTLLNSLVWTEAAAGESLPIVGLHFPLNPPPPHRHAHLLLALASPLHFPHALPPSGGFGRIQTDDLRWQQSVKSERRTADPTNHWQHGAGKKKSFPRHGTRTTASRLWQLASWCRRVAEATELWFRNKSPESKNSNQSLRRSFDHRNFKKKGQSRPFFCVFFIIFAKTCL